jgi:N6-L-threonylcarbamoyladenine synthase
MKRILAFETSCDDTAVAIVDDSGNVIAEAIFSQVKEHEKYLGVVPEVGSRAHIEQILHVTKTVFAQAKLSPTHIDAVAATFAPGLLGPLMVGAQFAKGFALALELPLIAVHHIEGHVFAGHGDKNFPKPPFLSMVASGGHTALYSCDEKYSLNMVSETLDDAAGEAFDKIGRALGLGYPAGKIIDELASHGDKNRFSLPIAFRKSDRLDFSFSGLKTKALAIIKEKSSFDKKMLADFCASLQETIAISLSERAMLAMKKLDFSSLVIAGGVAANSRFREMLQKLCEKKGYDLYLPEKKYCTDNAVMIAKAAHIRMAQGKISKLSVDITATLPIDSILQNLI